MRRVLLVLLVSGLVAGCPDSPEPPGQGTDTGDTSAPDTVTVADEGGDTGTSTPDVAAPDVEDDAGHEPDAVEDATPPPDVPPADCSFDPKPAGCECSDGPDCASEFCILSTAGKVCADFCTDKCPDGWSCEEIGLPGAGADKAFVCVERHVFLCRPCEANADCAAPGFQGLDQCVSYGDEGSYCGSACSAQEPCPSGFECNEDKYCVAKSGTCECAPLHITLEAITDCASTNEFGSCQGARECGVDGLTECTAAAPQAELCDSKDNDCDGATDEDVNTPCELKNDFGTCAGTIFCQGGTGVCQGTPPKSELCDGLDNDCDETIDEGFPDLDKDTLANCVDPDDDDDQWVDEDDNCPLHANPDQLDTDLDGMGDECDPDDDGDGVADQQDCKPLLKNVYPFAPEECDGVDNDCDSAIDEASCNDENPCTDDTCDPQAGCDYAPNANACNDGNPCTKPDACVAGSCDGEFINCNDDNPCTDDFCDQQKGCQNVPNTLACSDGNACTLGDVCTGGACLGGAVTTCDDGNPCTLDSCDQTAGCSHPPVAGSCNDGNKCTTLDACVGGVCVGDFVDCDDGNECTIDNCDTEQGCTPTPIEGKSCDDGNDCTEDTACDASGECVGEDLGCQCEQNSDCVGFEDDDLCNGTLFCDKSGPPPYSCEVDPNTIVACPVPAGLDGACTTSTCNPNTGTCSTKIGPDNVVCNDGSLCTSGDSCQAGACKGAVTPCGDGNDCTFDLCDPATGCVYPAVEGFKACDDGDACTVTDACASGECKGTGALPCVDGNQCTEDSCASATGCVYTPIDDLLCDDGDACSTVSKCIGDKCTGIAGLDCDDGDACNGVETCDAGGCQDGAALQCDDGIACTADSCDKDAGCVNTPADAACDDGKFCNGGETCDADTGCKAGTPPEIGDNVACTVDKCDEAQNKVTHTPKDTLCPGGADPCTAGSCDATDGCSMIDSPDGASCDDGVDCTGGALCLGGLCQGGKPCEEVGQICSGGACVGGGTATVRFVSASALLETDARSVQVVVTPTAAGTLKKSVTAVLSALAELILETQ